MIARWSTDREVPGSNPWCSVTFFFTEYRLQFVEKEGTFTHYPTMSNYCSYIKLKPVNAIRKIAAESVKRKLLLSTEDSYLQVGLRWFTIIRVTFNPIY